MQFVLFGEFRSFDSKRMRFIERTSPENAAREIKSGRLRLSRAN